MGTNLSPVYAYCRQTKNLAEQLHRHNVHIMLAADDSCKKHQYLSSSRVSEKNFCSIAVRPPTQVVFITKHLHLTQSSKHCSTLPTKETPLKIHDYCFIANLKILDCPLTLRTPTKGKLTQRSCRDFPVRTKSTGPTNPKIPHFKHGITTNLAAQQIATEIQFLFAKSQQCSAAQWCRHGLVVGGGNTPHHNLSGITSAMQ